MIRRKSVVPAKAGTSNLGDREFFLNRHTPCTQIKGTSEKVTVIAVKALGRVDKIEIFVIPAKAGIYGDVHQVIIGLKTPGFRFKTGMTGYLSTRPNPSEELNVAR